MTKEQRKLYQDMGICPECKKNRLYGNEKNCPECRARLKTYNEHWRKHHYFQYHAQARRGCKKLRDERKANGLCVRCGSPKLKTQTMCVSCMYKKRLEAEKARAKAKYQY